MWSIANAMSRVRSAQQLHLVGVEEVALVAVERRARRSPRRHEQRQHGERADSDAVVERTEHDARIALRIVGDDRPPSGGSRATIMVVDAVSGDASTSRIRARSASSLPDERPASSRPVSAIETLIIDMRKPADVDRDPAGFRNSSSRSVALTISE
jgi:hypothetical protein